MLVPGAMAFGELAPWSSHPDLDARWSTERTEMVPHGEALRLDKVRRLAGSQLASLAIVMIRCAAAAGAGISEAAIEGGHGCRD